MQSYLKAYKEFDHADRPDGWNAWITGAVVSACCRVLTGADPDQIFAA
jgi:hypothetical protein